MIDRIGRTAEFFIPEKNEAGQLFTSAINLEGLAYLHSPRCG